MQPHPYPGKLIVFEGGEGSGKTSHIQLIADDLRNTGRSVVFTKEPGTTEKGQKIRKILLDQNTQLTAEEELDLFIENRKDIFETIVIPALEQGDIILGDRSSPSTLAYQHFGRGVDRATIEKKDRAARYNIGFDLVILLDVDPAVGLARARLISRFELEQIQFHKRVRAGYLTLAHENSKHWFVVSAEQPFAIITAHIWKRVKQLL